MRLLNVDSLEFTEYNSDFLRPKYAIASHRWLDREATLQDIRSSTDIDSPGHQKVLAFARYVRENVPSVEWLWIDTCCINKDSSAELSEAVNLMFKWYKNAELCLAYLADVDDDGSAFTKSVWFERGWTLQELLAPKTVVFLTKDWHVIGHKGAASYRQTSPIGPNLDGDIASRTRVPEKVLRNYESSLSLPVETRLKWMYGRETTREEDMSYSLYGIFGVAPGANYGEEHEAARRRLLQAIDEKTKAAASKSDQAAEEGLTCFIRSRQLRKRFWDVLHRSPFTVRDETFLDLKCWNVREATASLALNWKTGDYTTHLQADDGDDQIAEIHLSIDWMPDEAPSTPELLWQIHTPNSLYYPGHHTGHLRLRNRSSLQKHFDIFTTFLRPIWESPIFSPFPNDFGVISSVGPLEEKLAPDILLPTLQTMAHVLAHRPFAPLKEPLFALHPLAGEAARYFPKQADCTPSDQDRCMRATTFFERAFGHSRNEEDDKNMDFILLPRQCGETSIMTIRELSKFYGLGEIFKQKADEDETWKLEASYAGVSAYSAWAAMDRVWARRVAKLVGFGFVLRAIGE